MQPTTPISVIYAIFKSEPRGQASGHTFPEKGGAQVGNSQAYQLDVSLGEQLHREPITQCETVGLEGYSVDDTYDEHGGKLRPFGPPRTRRLHGRRPPSREFGSIKRFGGSHLPALLILTRIPARHVCFGQKRDIITLVLKTIELRWGSAAADGA